MRGLWCLTCFLAAWLPGKPPDVAVALRVPAELQQLKLIYRIGPVSPSAARTLRIAGTVRVAIRIHPSGAVESAHAVSGHPLLAAAAVDAVKKWRYRQTLVRGTA